MPERQLRGLIVNDYDVSRIGVVLENGNSGWRDGLSVRDRGTQLPGRVGMVALSREFETTGRVLNLIGMQKATSMSQLQSWFREFKQRMTEGTIEIRFVDDLDKVYFGRTEDLGVLGNAPAFADGNRVGHRIRMQILCPDPLIYARFGTVAGFNSAAGEMPVGIAPSFPIIRINGAVTNPVITMKDFRGETIATLGLTAVIASGEFYEVNMDLSQIVDEVGDNQIDTMSSGGFFALDSIDSAGEDGPYPTLEVSPDAACEVLYRKAYL